MSKSRIIGVLKWVLAAALLTVLIRSGKLSLTDIQIFLKNPASVALCWALTFSLFCLAFLRWNLLLRSQGIALAYLRTFQLGMLGQFFSAVIPGTVGGDLVKAVYIARRFPAQKMRTVSTIFLDRVIGLSSMIIVGALAFLVGRSHMNLIAHPTIKLVELMGWALTCVAAGILAALVALPLVGKRLPAEITAGWFKKMPLSNALGSLYSTARVYHSKISYVWAALGISVCMCLMNVSVLFIIAKTIFGPYPWGQIDVPMFLLGSILGMAAQAIPIAPMGLGVGQVAFAAIFFALGAPSQAFGATMVTLMQAVNLAVNLCGAVFFATYRHEVHEGIELPT